MIKAIRKNQDGSLVKNSEREFSEHMWARMKFMFADKLRWVEVKSPPKTRKTPKEKSDVVITDSKQTYGEVPEKEVKELEDEFKDAEEIKITPRIKEEPKE